MSAASRTRSAKKLQRFRVAEAQAAQIPKPIRKIARAVAAGKTLTEIAARSQISEESARAVVSKLTRQGVLVPVAATANPQRSAREAAAFSAAELAFFESEVAPIDACEQVHTSWGRRFHEALCEWVVRLRGETRFL
ncbi:MAG: hypothetical protein H6707_10765 [Deltaproteobacteria bacterium]|nr:hypothetical protein [Deltaproteobacteria bacterium]